MDIRQVGVVGAGTMGNGIAHVFARSGFAVTLCDVEQRFLDRGLETISKNLEREASKGKISAEEKAASLERITPVVDRSKLSACDFVIEAATEKLEIKTLIAESAAKAKTSAIWTRSADRKLCCPLILLPSQLPNWLR